MENNVREQQIAVCRKYGAAYHPSSQRLKVGIARNVRTGMYPLNGLRHPERGDTSGWYVWAGEELSSAPDFFVPLHVEHISSWRPELLPFLGLPPGWRFLLAPGYEDAWYDPTLLETGRDDAGAR